MIGCGKLVFGLAAGLVIGVALAITLLFVVGQLFGGDGQW
jgi:hypothetical protein